MSARSRRKGIRFELEVARRLGLATGLPYQRVLTESRDGNVGDVDAPGNPFVVQAKVGARPNPFAALSEAVAASAHHPGRVPVAVCRRNGAGARPAGDVAVLRLDDFLRLIDNHERGPADG